MRRHSSIDVLTSALEPEPPDLGPHSSPDGAVTLLFTDIEDSTEIMERLGETRWFYLLREHNEIVREVVERHDGDVVKTQGDGFMIAFRSSHAALRCSIELQRAFVEHRNAELGTPLRVRIGVHSGSVIADAEDFFGRTVVLAARIADDAEGGEILVSSNLKQYTETDPTFRFEPRGERRLKGLSGQHALYAVDWAARDERGAALRG